MQSELGSSQSASRLAPYVMLFRISSNVLEPALSSLEKGGKNLESLLDVFGFLCPFLNFFQQFFAGIFIECETSSVFQIVNLFSVYWCTDYYFSDWFSLMRRLSPSSSTWKLFDVFWFASRLRCPLISREPRIFWYSPLVIISNSRLGFSIRSGIRYFALSRYRSSPERPRPFSTADKSPK